MSHHGSNSGGSPYQAPVYILSSPADLSHHVQQNDSLASFPPLQPQLPQNTSNPGFEMQQTAFSYPQQPQDLPGKGLMGQPVPAYYAQQPSAGSSQAQAMVQSTMNQAPPQGQTATSVSNTVGSSGINQMPSFFLPLQPQSQPQQAATPTSSSLNFAPSGPTTPHPYSSVLTSPIQTQLQQPHPSMAISAPSPNSSVTTHPTASRTTVMTKDVTNEAKVYVRNLGPSITVENLRDFFANFGALANVTMHKERGGTGHCAYVTFARVGDAALAIRQANGSTYFQTKHSDCVGLPPLSVRMAESLEERNERWARKTAVSIQQHGGLPIPLPPQPSYPAMQPSGMLSPPPTSDYGTGYNPQHPMYFQPQPQPPGRAMTPPQPQYAVVGGSLPQAMLPSPQPQQQIVYVLQQSPQPPQLQSPPIQHLPPQFPPTFPPQQ